MGWGSARGAPAALLKEALVGVTIDDSAVVIVLQEEELLNENFVFQCGMCRNKF